MHNTASEPSFPQPSKGGFRRGEYGGVNLSNPSYVKYYKGMLD